MACTTGCRTKDHASYGECLRSKRLTVFGETISTMDTGRERKWGRELDTYAEARKAGLQPVSTNIRDSRRALEIGV